MRSIRRTGERSTGLRTWVSRGGTRRIRAPLAPMCCGLVPGRPSHFRLMSIPSSALMICVSPWLFCREDSCISLFSLALFSPPFVPLFTLLSSLFFLSPSQF